jgi:hypothetical protein
MELEQGTVTSIIIEEHAQLPKVLVIEQQHFRVEE